MSPTCANTSTQSLPPLANNCINNVLLQSAPHFNQSLFKFVQNIDMSLVYSLLYDASNLVVDWAQVGAVWRPQISSAEVGGILLRQLNDLTRRHGPASYQITYLRLLDFAIVL